MRFWARLKLVGCALLFAISSASARTLEVGPDRELKNPSDAARIAADGDRIAIDPGEYYDCALWHANAIVIEAADPAKAGGVVLTDSACAGKASFVIDGRDVTLRGLTFTRIRVPDGNGAGIRAEGRNLTVEHCAFINNQTAILAADQSEGFLVVRDSEFSANGACGAGRCVGAIAVGQLARLIVEKSRFHDPRGSQQTDGKPAAGAQITSAAQFTELLENQIEDHAGASSFLVAYTGDGALLMTGNLLEKGPQPPDSRAAILATGTGWGHAENLAFRHNTLINHTSHPGVLLLNWTDADPELEQNILGADDAAVSSRGIWRHRLRYVLDILIGAKDSARHMAGSLRRKLPF